VLVESVKGGMHRINSTKCQKNNQRGERKRKRKKADDNTITPLNFSRWQSSGGVSSIYRKCTLCVKRENEDNKRKRKKKEKETLSQPPPKLRRPIQKPLPLRRDDLDIHARGIPLGMPLLRRTEMIAIIPNPVHGEGSSHLSILRKLENTLARPTTTGGFALLSNRTIVSLDTRPVIKVTGIRQESSAAITALPVDAPLLDVRKGVIRLCVNGAEPVDCARSAVRSFRFGDVSVFQVGALDEVPWGCTQAGKLGGVGGGVLLLAGTADVTVEFWGRD